MKNLSFKSVICLLLAVLLSFSVFYMPGLTLSAAAEGDCTSGHDFTAKTATDTYKIAGPTCDKGSKYYYSCSRCGEADRTRTFYSGSGLGHDLTPLAPYEATCTEGPGQRQECKRSGCDYTYTKPDKNGVPAGHKLTYRDNKNGTHSEYCMRSDCNYSKVINCSTAEIKCNKKQICDVCKAEYGAVVPHDLSKETYTKNPTCIADGEVIKACTRCTYSVTEVAPATGHDEVKNVTKAASCANSGSETVTCKKCSWSATREIKPLGHDYKVTTVPPTCKESGYDLHACVRPGCTDEGNSYKDNYNDVLACNYKEVVTAPTCIADGYSIFTCQTCGNFYRGNPTSKLGHDYEGFKVTKEPTCTEEGLKVNKCKRCSASTQEPIPATGHDEIKKVTPPTCTTQGKTETTCKKCNLNRVDEITKALGHDNERKNYLEPTCTLTGTEELKCKRCGVISRVNIDPLGHSFDYKSNGDAKCGIDGTKTGTCIRCPETDTTVDVGSALKHKYTTYVSNNNATCTADGTEWAVCDNGCGTKEERPVAGTKLGHAEEIIPAVPATCTKTGLTEGKKCSRCGEILIKQEVTEEIPHDYRVDIIENPTCDKEGSANYICKVCSHTYTGTVEATGNHTWDKGEITKKPACDDDGEKTFTCAVCKNTRVEVEPRLGHDFAKDFTIDEQATCYKEGERSKHCSRCDARIEVEKIEKNAHKFGEYTPDGNATCTTDGTKSKKCEFCEERTAAIPDNGSALGHDLTEFIPNGDATCIKDGTKTQTCKRPGCDYKDTQPDLGSAKGHQSFVNQKEPATCEKPGLTEGKTCKVCGEILVAQQLIPALGHDEVIKEELKPTCTEEGHKAGIYCNRCKKYLIESEKIPAKGHDYSKKVTKATTSKDGKIVYTCKVCKAVKTTKLYKVTSFALTQSQFHYNGKAQYPTKATVKTSNGKVLKAGTDYKVNKPTKLKTAIGTYSVKITLMGNYSGSKTLKFKIIPGDIKVNKKSATTSKVTLSWSKSEGATGYRVYYYNPAKKKWTILKKSTTAKSYAISKLEAGKTYLYSVKPYTKKGDTVIWGEGVHIEVATAPKATKFTSVSSTAKNTVSLKWNKVSGATGYVIYSSTSKDGTYKKLATVKTNSYTNKGLKGGKRIYFKVKAYRNAKSGNTYSAASSAGSVIVRAR